MRGVVEPTSTLVVPPVVDEVVSAAVVDVVVPREVDDVVPPVVVDVPLMEFLEST